MLARPVTCLGELCEPCLCPTFVNALCASQILPCSDEGFAAAAAGRSCIRSRQQVRSSRYQVLEPSHRQPPSTEGALRRCFRGYVSFWWSSNGEYCN